MEDGNFKKALQDILSLKNLTSLQSPAFALIENLKDFNAVFIPVELQNMRDAGLEYPAIFDSLQIASRERIRARLKDISAVAVLDSLQTAKQTVCQMAQSIVTERQRKAVQWTVGGVTLIVVDVAGAVGITSVSSGTLAVVAGAILVSSISVGAQAVVNGARGDIP